MTVLLDPAGLETQALLHFADFDGKRVLEIGCGDGRLTWRYASKTAHVDGLDPNVDRIAQAQHDLSDDLVERVRFHALNLEEFHAQTDKSKKYDLALLSWAL